MAITVRKARAEDAAFLARISLLASRAHIGWGFYDVMFPGTDEELLRRLMALALTDMHPYHHHSHRLVSEVNGTSGASLACYTAGDEATRLLLAGFE